MDRRYWEKIAPAYNEEIFDVLKNDRSGKIVKAIRQHSGKGKTVIDAGCAIGKWIPILSTQFKKVIAADISSKNLEIARHRCKAFTNVSYERIDLSRKISDLPACHVAVCINAILTDSLKKRIRFFQNLNHCLKPGGILVLVVPSLESKLYTHQIAYRWNVDQGRNEKIRSAQKAFSIALNIKQGVTDIDDVPTKHYLREELELVLSREGFRVASIEKINYPWKTEFHHPPRWLKEPYPWDWLIVAKKN